MILLLHYLLLLLLLLSSSTITNGFAPLRKHHYQIQSPIDEIDLLMQPDHHMLYSATASSSTATNPSVCGEASLSCMAFGYTNSSMPIRCGILARVAVCKRLDSVTNQYKCDSFCDTDGSGRLCDKAFGDCCRDSTNGCISSKPRNVKLYQEGS